MDKNILIRTCELQDEGDYIRLNLSFMKEVIASNPYWTTLHLPSQEEMKNIFLEAINMPENITIFIVEVEGTVIGFANVLTSYSIWSGGKALAIDDLYIDEAHRRGGIGEKVMEHILAFSKDNGYKRIQLHAETDNIKAHKLYSKMGFENEDVLFFMKKI